jgi:Bacterial antitoxin of type II TA system, VapB
LRRVSVSEIHAAAVFPDVGEVANRPHFHTWRPIFPSIQILSSAHWKSAVSGKKAAVTKALQEFIARRKQKRLLDLMGKLEWDQSYDFKSERSRS